MPKHICITCLNQLTLAYTFKKKCEQSDNVLKSFIAYCKKQREAAAQKPSQQLYCNEVLNQINESNIKIEAEVIIDSSSASEIDEENENENENEEKQNEEQNGINLITSESSSDSDNEFVNDDGIDYEIVKDLSGKYVCQSCHDLFISIKKLKNHVRTYHAGTNLKSCNICFKRK